MLNHNTLLQTISLPSVTNEQRVVSHNDLTNKELFEALKGTPNNKSLRNDGLTKEFYETFWDELKDLFISSINLPYQKKTIKHFSTSSSYHINRKNRSW